MRLEVVGRTEIRPETAVDTLTVVALARAWVLLDLPTGPQRFSVGAFWRKVQFGEPVPSDLS